MKSRHQRHIRLLKRLHQYGYVLTWVSNGTNICRGKICGTHHQFGMSRKWNKLTPPLVPLKKGISPYLVFTIEGKDGDLQFLLGWKHLAEFVQHLDNKKQKEESRKAKEIVA